MCYGAVQGNRGSALESEIMITVLIHKVFLLFLLLVRFSKENYASLELFLSSDITSWWTWCKKHARHTVAYEAVHWAMYVPVPAIAKLKSLF